jgi:putative membrane protein
MPQERVLREATISPNAVRYQTIAALTGLGVSVFGIPLIPIVVPLVRWYWTRHYARLRVSLTTRELKVHRGVMNREEKSIPLEKITDLAVFQGPIMRRMGLKGIKVETAGQSSGPGALVSIVGIEDTDAFRDAVLAQRDRVAEREEEARAAAPAAAAGDGAADQALLQVVTEIRDLLRRMEGARGG